MVRLLEDLSGSAEALFSRLFGVWYSRDQVLVKAQDLQDYQGRAQALQDRARQQALELARLMGVLGLIEEGVIIQGADGRVLLMNEAAKALLGSSKNLWQSGLGQLFRQAQGLAPVQNQMQVVGQSQEIQVNNKTLAVRLAAMNDPQGGPLGTVMLLRDTQPAMLGERLKASFIAQISHELRTPLTAIKGASEVLLNTPEGRPPKRSLLEAISRNVAILDRMVVELLDASELSSGNWALQTQALRLDELSLDVLRGFEPDIYKAGLQVTSMVANVPGLAIQGDPRRLQWAIGHVVDNAIKYTPPQGQIIVQIGQRRGERIVVQISDTGVGISAEDLPHIFERFYRGTPRTAQGKVLDPRGLGQGLYVVESVIRAHGGAVTVASVPGQGTSFILELPLELPVSA